MDDYFRRFNEQSIVGEDCRDSDHVSLSSSIDWQEPGSINALEGLIEKNRFDNSPLVLIPLSSQHSAYQSTDITTPQQEQDHLEDSFSTSTPNPTVDEKNISHESRKIKKRSKKSSDNDPNHQKATCEPSISKPKRKWLKDLTEEERVQRDLKITKRNRTAAQASRERRRNYLKGVEDELQKVRQQLKQLQNETEMLKCINKAYEVKAAVVTAELNCLKSSQGQYCARCKSSPTV